MNRVLFNSLYDWNYTTVADGRIDQAHINENLVVPRGRMLGGSSSINAMIYVRGSRQDYQNWYDQGNNEWHPDIVEKYFEKAENFQDNKFRNTPVYNLYGHNGPLVINTFNYTDRTLTNNVLKAWQDIGIDTVQDLNGPKPVRAGILRATAYNGKRESSAKAYLNFIQDRKNLKVIKDTLVTKLLIKGHTVYGVEIEKNGVKKNIIATNEVIVSGGAINTPQLLLLSGIGPKKHLKSLKIKTIVDLPVGKNLQDHIMFPVTIYGNDGEDQDPNLQYFNTMQYLYNATGPLSQLPLNDILAFYDRTSDSKYPIYQNHFLFIQKNSAVVRNMFSNQIKLQDEVVDSIAELNKNHTLYLYLFNLLHPTSRGNITLRSKDPHVHPIIHQNLLSTESDLNDSVQGINILLKILDTEYFKSIGGFLGRIKWKPCDHFIFRSDDYWKCTLLNIVYTVYHASGTAKMGPDPKDSVVDSRLRVHGVNKLRVVDASIMPTVTSGNTNGPTTMIGERASDLIKEDHGKFIL